MSHPNSLQDISYILTQFTITKDDVTEEIDLVAQIISSQQMPDDNKYIHRAKFLYKDGKIKEKIISFVFEEERRIRKKEQGM